MITRNEAHAYGAGKYFNEGYREYFCTHSGNLQLLRLAWEFGLFHGPRCADGAAYFNLTELGKRVAAGEIKTYPGYAQ